MELQYQACGVLEQKYNENYMIRNIGEIWKRNTESGRKKQLGKWLLLTVVITRHDFFLLNT